VGFGAGLEGSSEGVEHWAREEKKEDAGTAQFTKKVVSHDEFRVASLHCVGIQGGGILVNGRLAGSGAWKLQRYGV